MTTPNNQPPSPAPLFAITGTGTASDGSGTTPADLLGRTQDAIMALLGETQIKQSPGWNSSSTSVYAGLTPGIPLTLAIIEQFVSKITGLAPGTWNTVNEALLAMEGISSNADLQANWTTIFTDLDVPNAAALADLVTTLQNDGAAGSAAFSTLWTSWQTAYAAYAASGFTAWSTYIAAVEAGYQTYITTVTSLESGEFATLQQLVGTLFGVNPVNTSTGLTGYLKNLSSSGAWTGALDTLSTDVQDYFTNIDSGGSWTGGLTTLGTEFGDVLTNLFSAGDPTSAQVQPSAMSGIQGITSMESSVQNILDQWSNAIASALGLSGVAGSNNSLSAATNAVSAHAAATSQALSGALSAVTVQAQQVSAKPGWMAVDSSMDAVFPISHMIVAPQYISVTQASSEIGYICIPDNVSKLSVGFVGYYAGSITDLYINVYSMDPGTGALTKVIAGANISGSVGTGLSSYYYNLPSALAATVGAWFAVELVVVGSGTFTLLGVSDSTLPQSTATYPYALGASRVFTPIHDASGVGSFTSTSGTVFPWSHPVAAAATGILIEFAVVGTGASVSSVKVGSATATLLASKVLNASVTAYVYELLDPPTGTPTVTVTLSASAYLAGNSDSYIGVTAFGTPASNSGASAGTASVAVSSAVGQTAVAAIFALSSVSAFTQTSHWSNGNSTLNLYGVFGDAPGASTVNFAATAGAAWAAIGVSLVGSPATAPATITNPTYSTNVPWFGLGAATEIAAPMYAPETYFYDTPGTISVTPPAWATKVDRVLNGGGGGGGGGVNGPGSPGGSSSVTVGSNTLTANGGAGGLGGDSSIPYCYGQSPGSESYNGASYPGGSEVSYGQPGSAPGGGGGSGYYSGLVGHGGSAGSWAYDTQSLAGISSISVTIGAGGQENTFDGLPSYGAQPGAPGGVWLRFSQ